MRITLLVFVLIGTAICKTANAQNQNDTIEVVNKFIGTGFYFHSDPIPPRALADILKSVPQTNIEMHFAKKNHLISSALRIIGGSLLGFAVAGYMLNPHDTPKYSIAAVGSVLICVSVPFATFYTKHAKSAVVIYNNSFKKF